KAATALNTGIGAASVRGLSMIIAESCHNPRKIPRLTKKKPTRAGRDSDLAPFSLKVVALGLLTG
ncbi:MAG: hypothetical protein ACRECH_10500, partial [Nitrososphaerales archaeon]